MARPRHARRHLDGRRHSVGALLRRLGPPPLTPSGPTAASPASDKSRLAELPDACSSLSPARPAQIAPDPPKRGRRRLRRRDLGPRRLRQRLPQRVVRGGSGRRPRRAGASGTLNWEWELPTSWDPVTSTAGWDMHALCLVYASVTTLNRQGRPPAGPGVVMDVRGRRQERDVHAPAGPEVLRRLAARPPRPCKENIQRGLTQSELDCRLRAVGHLQGRRQQPDQLHPGPEPGRLPDAGPPRGQGRHDRQPGLLCRGQGDLASQCSPGRRAVHADQLRARTRTPTWCATRATGTPARFTSRASTCCRSPSLSRSWPRLSPGRSTWPTSRATRWRRRRRPGSRSR